VSIPHLNELPDPPQGETGWPWTEQGTSPREQNTRLCPKISVVTPTYNQGDFIEETIRSVLLQRYPNTEYIVIDGGSTDKSLSVIKQYASWIDHWISEEDEGQSDAINKGLEWASGDILAWLNSDDYYAAGALNAVGRKFQKYSNDVGALVGTGHKINKNKNIIYTPEGSDLTYEAFLHWMSGGSFMQPACFFRRAAWEECGPLRTDLQYAMDVDLWLKMARLYRFERIDKTLSYAYRHEGAKTTGERQRWRAEVILQLYEHGGYEAAYHEAMEMADELHALRTERQAMNRHPIFRWAMRVWRYLLK